LDGVIAPAISAEAVELLKRKKDKCRILINPALKNLDQNSLQQELRLRQVRGGFLLQPNFTFILDFNLPELATTGTISVEQQKDLVLAWAIGSTSNSNTTTIVKNGQLLGNGVGQQSRVASCQIAVFRAKEAKHDTNEAVAYTDSFFPFADGPAVLADAGIKVIFSSSGSVKDQEVRDYCQSRGVTLLQLPDVVCRGFFGH
jgi:phosphoribosylaminoimidazolecarboxamide formyltransferase/IMP cyclohydrolase